MKIGNIGQFRLRHLLIAVGILSLGLAAVATGSHLLLNVLFTLTLCVLCVATVGTLIGRSHTQKRCAGIATCGWVYFAVAFVPWFRVSNIYYLLVSTVVSDMLYPMLQPSTPKPEMYFRYSDLVAHGMHLLFTLLVAWIGGVAATYWLTDELQRDNKSTNPPS